MIIKFQSQEILLRVFSQVIILVGSNISLSRDKGDEISNPFVTVLFLTGKCLRSLASGAFLVELRIPF